MLEYNLRMPRTATTIDIFSAVAKPKRRRVLGVLFDGERSVNDLVTTLKWPQPQVSKHLGVLRRVGLVSVRYDGRHRFYRVNGARLKPIHDWVVTYEKFWKFQLDRIKVRAEAKARAACFTKPTQ
jgi:DNA-binding transcriptional ArsR family regulator